MQKIIENCFSLISSCSFFVAFVVSLVLLTGCGRAPRHTTWQSATGAGEYERLMWRAVQQKDWQQFEYHLAAGFVGVNAAGQVFDRNAWVEYWKNAQVQEAVLTDLQTRPEGADMVVTFVLGLSVSAPTASPGKQTYRVVSVWQQFKTGWTLTATSIVPIARD